MAAASPPAPKRMTGARAAAHNARRDGRADLLVELRAQGLLIGRPIEQIAGKVGVPYTDLVAAVRRRDAAARARASAAAAS